MDILVLELFLWFSTTLFSTYHCYSSGAPVSACLNMTPKHRNSEPMIGIPTDIKLTSQVHPRPDGDRVTVTLKGDIIDFKGFLIQARDIENTSHIINGLFTAPAGSQVLNCMFGYQNSLTHTRGEPKQVIEAKWSPPPLFHGGIIFRSTIVHNYTSFWVGVNSNSLHVQGKIGYIQTEQCGKSKGCFGIPADCIQKGSCRGLVTYVPSTTDDVIEFELYADIEPEAWIGVALSEDDLMGNDSVMECIHANGIVIFQNSWNEEGKKNRKLDKPIHGVGLDSNEYDNGLLVCKWRRNYVTLVENTTFNMRDNMYHLLMAIGPLGKYEGKGMHNLVSASAVPINLTTVVHILPTDTPLPIIEKSTVGDQVLPSSARAAESHFTIFSILLKLVLIYGFLGKELTLFV